MGVSSVRSARWRRAGSGSGRGSAGRADRAPGQRPTAGRGGIAGGGSGPVDRRRPVSRPGSPARCQLSVATAFYGGRAGRSKVRCRRNRKQVRCRASRADAARFTALRIPSGRAGQCQAVLATGTGLDAGRPPGVPRRLPGCTPPRNGDRAMRNLLALVGLRGGRVRRARLVPRAGTSSTGRPGPDGRTTGRGSTWTRSKVAGRRRRRAPSRPGSSSTTAEKAKPGREDAAAGPPATTPGPVAPAELRQELADRRARDLPAAPPGKQRRRAR